MTTTRAAVLRVRSVTRVTIAVALVAALGRPAHADDKAADIPDNVHISPELQPLSKALLEKSATFRSQCDRIGREPRVYVRAGLDARLEGTSFRARSVIRRSVDGAVVAFVYVAPFGDRTEWLAHELEHVIEQLEGVKLAALAARHQGAWHTADNTFETVRAIRAGHSVVDEMGGRAGEAKRAVRGQRERVVSGDD